MDIGVLLKINCYMGVNKSFTPPLAVCGSSCGVDALIYMEKTAVVNRDSGFEDVLTPPLVSMVLSNLISLVFSRKLKWK